MQRLVGRFGLLHDVGIAVRLKVLLVLYCLNKGYCVMQAPPAVACSLGVFAFASPPPLFLPLGAQLLAALALAGLSRHGAAGSHAERRLVGSWGCGRRPHFKDANQCSSRLMRRRKALA